MAQSPAYYAPEQRKTAYPPQGSYPQSQSGAYPPGQSVAYTTGQAQPGVAYPGQQVITTQGNAAPVYTGTAEGGCGGSAISEHYNAAGGLGTGVTHLVASVLSIILGGVAFAFPVLHIGYGIWSAIIFFLPTGILGVVSKNKNSCVVVAYMVMSILTSLHAIGMLAYEAFVAAVLTYFTSCYVDNFFGYTCDYVRSVGAVAIHSVLALLALVEFINSIVSAAYCCNGHACCCAPPPTNQGSVNAPTVMYNM